MYEFLLAAIAVSMPSVAGRGSQVLVDHHSDSEALLGFNALCSGQGVARSSQPTQKEHTCAVSMPSVAGRGSQEEIRSVSIRELMAFQCPL